MFLYGRLIQNYARGDKLIFHFFNFIFNFKLMPPNQLLQSNYIITNTLYAWSTW